MIRLVKRPSPSRFWTYATPLFAVLLTMIAGGLLFAALGKDPFLSIKTIFFEPLFGKNAFYYRSQLPIKAAPLVLIATGLALGFRAGIWNIGAEGQYIMGAIIGAAVGLAFYPMESRWILPLVVIAGALGGMVWALIPAFLKTRFGTSEILVSLMLVYVAENLLASMSIGLLKNPEGFGFPGSRNLSQYVSTQNLEIWSGTGIH
ncbi:MAG: ABC transporter permease, partial [Deltaproteobacteria bacterium]